MSHTGGEDSSDHVRTSRGDIGWKFGTPIEGGRHKVLCTFCNIVINGSVTRFKEHLAHIKGNVTGCEKVSGEVRSLIVQHIKEGKEKRKETLKRKEELHSHLRGDWDERYQLNEDSEDEDYNILIARQESIRSQHEWEERQRFKARMGVESQYDVGGASGSQPPLSFSQRSKSSRKFGEQEIRRHRISTTRKTAENVLREMDPILQKSKSAKQARIEESLQTKSKKKKGNERETRQGHCQNIFLE